MNGTYTMRWPIIDMRLPLADLLGQAMQDLAAELRSRILRQVAPVEWSITRDHAGMILVATVPVSTPSREEDRDLSEHRRRRATVRATGDDIRELLAMGETHAAIAARFGITEAAVDRARYDRRIHQQESS